MILYDVTVRGLRFHAPGTEDAVIAQRCKQRSPEQLTIADSKAAIRSRGMIRRTKMRERTAKAFAARAYLVR